ncbi:MAG: hypothetical protein HGJ94_07780 [Desulfosarcina sp.]|nr:hypothetical protein [Desulfosarcina sp.]
MRQETHSGREWRAAVLCSGYGQWHSPKNKKNPRDYVGITLSKIEAMMADPRSAEKQDAQWVIFSTLPSRVHAEQRKQGRFHALWADIDETGGITFDEIIERANGCLLEYLAYTSRSATKEKQKARIIVPLAVPVSGEHFVMLQKILNDKLQLEGIAPDRATERAGQVCYLPNKGEYYRHHAEMFGGPMHPSAWGDEITKEQQHCEAAKMAAQERREQARAKATRRMQSGCKSPIDAYNSEYDLPSALDWHGYSRRGNRWLSPNSQSGAPGVTLSADGKKWLSTHGSDAGIGQPTANGTMGDAFDLFIFYEHHGDRNTAIKAAGKMFGLERMPSPQPDSFACDNEAPPFDSENGPKQEKKSIIGGLISLAVGKEYTEMLGEESWLFPNVIIRGQIHVIIAKTGGGKSTIFFDYISPWILDHHDVEILYMDCDSPASDHKVMFQKAEKNGSNFHWINPITHGKGPEALIGTLESLVKQKENLTGRFLILDTLKKFINLMDKQSVKPFFVLMRQLVSLGATIALLGHANKYRDGGGNLVFEGVGDVQSDTDALIFFERIGSINGIDITTVVDPDRGAKVRGLFEPVSFHIEHDTRLVTQHQQAIPVPDWCGEKKRKISSEDVEDVLRDFITGGTGHVKRSEIIESLNKVQGIPYNKLLSVLNACACHEKLAVHPGQIFFSVGQRGEKSYSVVGE